MWLRAKASEFPHPESAGPYLGGAASTKPALGGPELEEPKLFFGFGTQRAH